MILDKVYPCHEIVKMDYYLRDVLRVQISSGKALVALVNGREMELPYEVFKFD